MTVFQRIRSILFALLMLFSAAVIIVMPADAALILIAFAFGSKWYIATILMALTLGPVIEFVGKRIKKWFRFE